MSYQLVVVVGRSVSQAIKVPQGMMLIGRQHDCQLRIGSSQVSRRHCQLDCGPAQLVITDLGSSNGTTVNGEKLQPKGKRVLANGDVIEVGNVKFRVEQIEETALMPGSQRPTGVKPADTAMSEAIALDEQDIASDEATQVVRTNGVPGRPAAPVAAETAGIGEDEVADFLMNIELDEEDKL